MNLANLKPTIGRTLDGACGRFRVRSTWKADVGHLARTPPQASPRHPPNPIPSSQTFWSDFARAEGWDVSECGLRDDGTPRIEIQRLDSVAPGQPRFRTDGAAWEHVVTRALESSALHLAALAMLDPTERKLIRLWCPTAARLP